MKQRIRREKAIEDVERYGEAALRSDVMRKAFEQKHHLRSTVGEHTIRVACAAVMICYVLRRLRVRVDVPAVVVGSLCHDLGMIGRKEKYASSLESYRKHPGESAEVARQLYPDMSEKTEEIIRRHMWPMRKSRVPNSLEGFVVSAADKYSSVADLIRGGNAPGADREVSGRLRRGLKG